MKYTNFFMLLVISSSLTIFSFNKANGMEEPIRCDSFLKESKAQVSIPEFLSSTGDERNTARQFISESIIHTLIHSDPSLLWMFKLSPNGTVVPNMKVIDFVVKSEWQDYLIYEVSKRSEGEVTLVRIDPKEFKGPLVMGPGTYYELSKGNEKFQIHIGPYLQPISDGN